MRTFAPLLLSSLLACGQPGEGSSTGIDFTPTEETEFPESNLTYDPNEAYTCDFSELEGTWSGAFSGRDDVWMTLDFRASAERNEPIGSNELAVDYVGSCYFVLECRHDMNGTLVVWNEVDPNSDPTLGCYGGFYLLDLDESGEELTASFRDTRDGTDQFSTKLTRTTP